MNRDRLPVLSDPNPMLRYVDNTFFVLNIKLGAEAFHVALNNLHPAQFHL